MSCFIVETKTFQRVVKIAFIYGLHRKERGEYPSTLEEVNNWVEIVAKLNAKNYSARYNEDVELEVELFTDLPELKITPQDIKSTKCWMYQTEDYFDKDKYFLLIADAVEWALSFTGISQEELGKAEWK